MEQRVLEDEYRLLHLTTDELLAQWRDGFVDAYVTVFEGEPYQELVTTEQAGGVYDRLTSFPDAITLVAADADDQVIGFAIAIPLRNTRTVHQILTGLVPMKHTYYLAELGVRPSHRSKGLGRVLISERLRLMDTNRYSHVVLRISEKRSASSELYEALGFEDMGVSMEVTSLRTDGVRRPDTRIFLHRVLSQVDID